MYTMLAHPLWKLARFANGEFREVHVRGATSYLDEVIKNFVFRIRTRKELVRMRVGAPDISCVPRVSTAHALRSALNHDDAGDAMTRRNCRANRGITATDHDDIIPLHSTSFGARRPADLDA